MSTITEKDLCIAAICTKGQCEYCHYPQKATNTPLEIEHIMPRSKQGKTVPKNLALACRRCNSHKSNKTDGIDSLTGEVARLFDPRSDDWDVHFCLNIRAGKIEGRTPIGRVTAQELSMNAPLAVANRLLLIENEMFPIYNEP